LFLQSCEKNVDIDFLIFTDNNIKSTSNNIKIINTDFILLKQRIGCLYDFPIALSTPYKLCDYKPAYGEIFKEELTGYNFWGHCDIDMIFGDLRKFITEQVLDSHEKIYQLGHLCLYKNTEENNGRYRKGSGMNYREVFGSDIICVFDEGMGIQQKYETFNIPVYLSRDYADINWGKNRFMLSDDFLTKEQKENNNYADQVFYYDRGKVYRAYVLEDVIFAQEFCYIHLAKRKLPIQFTGRHESFFITNKGFYPKLSDTLKLTEIRQYNKTTWAKELFAALKYRRFIWRRRWRKYFLKKA
jgi:hypothetical protein